MSITRVIWRVFHSDEKETGLDISDESGTSIFIKSVIKEDKIVGWIKYSVKIVDEKYNHQKLKSGVVTVWHYLLPWDLELLFLSSALRELLLSLELGFLEHLLGLSSLCLDLELLELLALVLVLVLE